MAFLDYSYQYRDWIRVVGLASVLAKSVVVMNFCSWIEFGVSSLCLCDCICIIA